MEEKTRFRRSRKVNRKTGRKNKGGKASLFLLRGKNHNGEPGIEKACGHGGSVVGGRRSHRSRPLGRKKLSPKTKKCRPVKKKSRHHLGRARARGKREQKTSKLGRRNFSERPKDYSGPLWTKGKKGLLERGNKRTYPLRVGTRVPNRESSTMGG